MTRTARSFASLRTRLFVATGLVVLLAVGVTFGAGLYLTLRSVEKARLDDLSHQADLLAERESQFLLPFSRIGRLLPFLEDQDEKIEIVDLRLPSSFLSDEQRERVLAGEPVHGRITVAGDTYLFAARNVSGKGFVLMRPANLNFADWWPFLQALLIAGAVAALLAAIAALLSARTIARPVRRVAEASRSLAEGISPEPVPVGGSSELALLAEAFNEMAEQLTRAREAERNFLLSVSHELKTPLTAIRGYAEGLEEGAFQPEEAAATIRDEARRLERLVRDLLDLARMNRSEFTVHHDEFDLAEVAREAVRRYEQEARAEGIELEIDGDGPAPVEGDHDRAVQVVSNLVENALRWTPSGGSVWVRIAPGTLAVEDTGRGLPPEDLEHAFQRFYLYDRNPDGKRIGSGLGLAIVKELTEKMGGSVSVESSLGEGSRFTVRLPVPRSRIRIPGRRRAASPARGR